MNLTALIRGVPLPRDFIGIIDRLRDVKARGTEATVGDIPTEIGVFIEKCLQVPCSRPMLHDVSDLTAEANAIMVRTVTGRRTVPA